MSKDYHDRLQKFLNGDPEGRGALRDPGFLAAFQADLGQAMTAAKARYKKEKSRKEAALRRKARTAKKMAGSGQTIARSVKTDIGDRSSVDVPPAVK